MSTRPLLFGLLHDDGLRGRVCFEPASAVTELFARGRCDAALIPTIEYLRGTGQHMVPGPALVGRSNPGSLMLLAHKPLEELERIAVGEYCRNAVAVLRIVLAEKHGVFPDLLVEKRIGGDDWRDRYDAVLLTGDAAFRMASSERVGGVSRHNLADAWRSVTGTPLVHAVWVYDDRRLASEISLLLTSSRDEGCGRLPTVSEDIARSSGLDAMLVYDYLSRAWTYELGEEELEGVRALNDLARKYDLIRNSRFATSPVARTV